LVNGFLRNCRIESGNRQLEVVMADRGHFHVINNTKFVTGEVSFQGAHEAQTFPNTDAGISDALGWAERRLETLRRAAGIKEEPRPPAPRRPGSGPAPAAAPAAPAPAAAAPAAPKERDKERDKDRDKDRPKGKPPVT
jgi:hypothetical protein